MKKIFLFLCIISQTFLSALIETERTIWRPWNLQDSQEWYDIEKNDPSISYFRRNEYFEDLDTVLLRDRNWLKLSHLVTSAITKKPFFPDLGFAIIQKDTLKLIGAIRFKFSSDENALSFGYGLHPEARNGKFGQEIISALIDYIKTIIGSKFMNFTTKKNKEKFFQLWHEEGKRINPDFSTLLSCFNQELVPLNSIKAFVDLNNPASLNILLRNNMHPFAIECNKYTMPNNTTSYGIDFILEYPSLEKQICDELNKLAHDIISRDNQRIQYAHSYIHELFNIESNWSYVQLSFEAKALMRPLKKTSYYYSCLPTKNIISQIYFPPFCQIR